MCIPPSGARSWRATATGQSENRDKPREVVQGCITRWRVEETIRYIKQSYRLEHMRLLDYQRLKNMSSFSFLMSRSLRSGVHAGSIEYSAQLSAVSHTFTTESPGTRDFNSL